MKPSQDFLDLFPKPEGGPSGPVYWLWVFNPVNGVTLAKNNQDAPRADTITHSDLAEEVDHPDRLHGYAYPIRGGYRLTDWDHRPVGDPFIVKSVLAAINEKA